MEAQLQRVRESKNDVSSNNATVAESVRYEEIIKRNGTYHSGKI